MLGSLGLLKLDLRKYFDGFIYLGRGEGEKPICKVFTRKMIDALLNAVH
jgi:hypothetical protein